MIADDIASITDNVVKTVCSISMSQSNIGYLCASYLLLITVILIFCSPAMYTVVCAYSPTA